MDARGPDAPRLKPEMASRKLLVLAFVRDYIERWQGSPSYGEISAGVGISPTRAKQLVKALVREHKLLRRPGTRGLSLPARQREAIRMLRDQGWRVYEADKAALAPGCPNPTLSVPPVLDYVPPSKGDEHDAIEVGRTPPGKGRRRGRARRSQSGRTGALESQDARHDPDA